MTQEGFDIIRAAFVQLYRLFTSFTIPGTTLTPMFLVTAPWLIAASVRIFKAITGNAAGGFGEASSLIRNRFKSKGDKPK